MHRYGPFDLYDGSHIATFADVVVVSCNYRLGALGALVHGGGASTTHLQHRSPFSK